MDKRRLGKVSPRPDTVRAVSLAMEHGIFREPSESESITTSQADHELDLASVLMAGFECTAALTSDGKRLDLLHSSGHDVCVRSDYETIAELGMKTVREGFAWSSVDVGGRRYDFNRYRPILAAGSEMGVQQIWDLSHFDFPERLDPMSWQFAAAYAEYAKRVIEVLRQYNDGTLYIVPMNEPSFFSWMSECGLWAPFLRVDGIGFKRQLVRAATAAMDAIWSSDRDVRFIHADPFMYRLPERPEHPGDVEYCRDFNDYIRWQSWDMIAGRVEPELGGRPEFLDIIGVNYYIHNQQFAKTNGDDEPGFRCIELNDERRLTLSDLFRQIYARYERPMLMTETGSFEGLRPGWWDITLRQILAAMEENIPVYGVCSYPTLDVMPDAGFIAPESGLWDFDPADPECRRIPHAETLDVIRRYAPLLAAKGSRGSLACGAHG
jgi:beta-glucosidase/6-phospho-beta-glucosidase/beta-galactosidase